MVVHFLPYKSKHHLKPRIEVFSKFGSEEKCLFILYGANKNKPFILNELKEIKLIHCSGKIDILRIFLKYGFSTQNKFVLHGYLTIFFLLSFFPFFKASKMWVVWGSGLSIEKNNFKRRLQFNFKRILYNKIDKINCLMNGETEVLKDSFKVKENKIFIIPYKLLPHKIFSKQQILEKMSNPVINILVGNQANRHQNHLKILNDLSKFKDEGIMIHLFLNYPKNEDYINEIKKEGTKIFKDKINFITKILSPEEYLTVMKIIHITILDVKKQTGLAAIYKTIDYGGIVFLNKDGLNKKWLNYLNIKSGNVHDIEKYNSARELFFLSKEDIFNNLENRLLYFDINKTRKDWIDFIYN